MRRERQERGGRKRKWAREYEDERKRMGIREKEEKGMRLFCRRGGGGTYRSMVVLVSSRGHLGRYMKYDLKRRGRKVGG